MSEFLMKFTIYSIHLKKEKTERRIKENCVCLHYKNDSVVVTHKKKRTKKVQDK